MIRSYIRKNLKNFILKFVKKFGYKIVKDLPNQILYEYSSYEEYKKIQISENMKRIDKVWADEASLKIIAERIQEEFKESNLIEGICHGARNGFEVKTFQKAITNKNKIIGTDISPTASNFKDLIVWDFHDKNNDWIKKFDFVYSNALDQSWKPNQALNTWLEQLKDDGILILDMTIEHGTDGANLGDPFGVMPDYFPYYLTENFGHKISIDVRTSIKENSKLKCYFFFIKKVS